MARKETFLASICYQLFNKSDHSRPTSDLIKSSGRFDEVYKVYKDLGGILDIPPINPGKWDIDIESCVIELDEENHFNRYRLITLNAPLYQDYNNFDVEKYKQYCSIYEKRCPTGQGRWSNSSTEKQFGKSNKNGDLSGNGSSRWRQRAFYDYLKDLYSVITGIPVIRISIYDQVQDSTIKQVLKNEDLIKVRDYLKRRITL